jgi:hypothetical protein
MSEYRAEYGDGAEHFEHAGLDCKIVKTSLGHWCGYVRRPESVEPVRWMSDYDSKHDEVLDAEVDVWCGITYGPDADGWVGFDDAHATPLVDERAADTDKAAVKTETKYLAEQIAKLADGAPDREPRDGESYGDGGEIRPVPPGVENEPEGSRDA